MLLFSVTVNSATETVITNNAIGRFRIQLDCIKDLIDPGKQGLALNCYNYFLGKTNPSQSITDSTSLTNFYNLMRYCGYYHSEGASAIHLYPGSVNINCAVTGNEYQSYSFLKWAVDNSNARVWVEYLHDSLDTGTGSLTIDHRLLQGAVVSLNVSHKDSQV